MSGGLLARLLMRRTCGYEHFEEKLKGLGAMIERAECDKDLQKFRLKIG